MSLSIAVLWHYWMFSHFNVSQKWLEWYNLRRETFGLASHVDISSKRITFWKQLPCFECDSDTCNNSTSRWQQLFRGHENELFQSLKLIEIYEIDFLITAFVVMYTCTSFAYHPIYWVWSISYVLSSLGGEVIIINKHRVNQLERLSVIYAIKFQYI